MSLFGTSPDDLPQPKQSALFDDDSAQANKTTSSLFGDDIDGSDSPWAYPTPKKSARANVVKTLLPAAEVPESYIDTYDTLLADGDRLGGGASLSGIRKLLNGSKLGPDEQGKILDIVVPNGQEPENGVGRGEFNVLLALVGLAQEGEDITLDGVDERRRKPSLDIPKPAKKEEAKEEAPTPISATPPNVTKPVQPTTPKNQSTPTMRKASFGLDADPWNSPDMHRGHSHNAAAESPHTNGTRATAPVLANGNGFSRTTSGFTTAADQSENPGNGSTLGKSQPSNGDNAGWGGFGESTGNGFSNAGLGEGFGAPPGEGDGGNDPTGLGRSLGGGRVANNGAEEVITVTAIPEKEGIFLFQHRNYQEMFDTVRSGVRRSAEMYINLCQLMERLCKRNEGMAADYMRFGLALQALTEASKDTYAVDTNDVPLLNEGLQSTAKHLQSSQSLLEDEARAWDEGMLEDLKRQRDCLVSMRDLFDRRDRLDRDNIPQLERRIQNNENKLQGIRNRPEHLVKPGEAEKVEEAIVRDKQSIVNQHARSVFIKECIRDEIMFFQQSMYHVSKLHQDWSQERVKYAELQADNWRALGEEVEGMPLGD
ncbi:Sorting nexin mvp1 [Botryosphaeria dothidea]